MAATARTTTSADLEGRDALLARYADRTAAPVIDLGHFGGGMTGRRLREADGAAPALSLDADLRYWDRSCAAVPRRRLRGAQRLRDVLSLPVSQTAMVPIASCSGPTG